MLKKRSLLLSIFIIIIALTVNGQNAKGIITVGEVIDRIKENVTCEWQSQTVDNLKTGSLDQPVTGIATTFLSTLEVLKKAKELNINLIITHEPTFYNHFDNQETLVDDPVQKAKMKFIQDNNLAIFRYHDHLHKTEEDLVAIGLMNDFGWQKYKQEDQMIFHIPHIQLTKIGAAIEQRYNNGAVRVVGKPDMKISKVGIVPGAYGSYTQIEMLNEDIDLLIVGETREWETVEYVRDAIEADFQKSLIIMGHADSEENGMRLTQQWLEGFINEVPIRFIPAGNPLWSPN